MKKRKESGEGKRRGRTRQGKERREKERERAEDPSASYATTSLPSSTILLSSLTHSFFLSRSLSLLSLAVVYVQEEAGPTRLTERSRGRSLGKPEREKITTSRE